MKLQSWAFQANRARYQQQSDAARNNRIVYTRPIPNRPVPADRQLIPFKVGGYMKSSWALFAALLLTGCAPDPTMPMDTAVSAGGDWNVKRVGVFSDEIAYNNRRGIYIIRNSRTGQELIGVSGVGVTEVTSHPCGKSCIQEDER